MEFLKNLYQKVTGKNRDTVAQNPDQAQQTADDLTDEVLDDTQSHEVVSLATKIKVVAALAVVGFAAYVAYWIQEPVEVRTDLLGNTPMMQSGTQSQTQATQAVAESMTQQVSIANLAYDPATLSVTQGTTVVWTNNDTVPHNVVGDTFASYTLNPGDTFSYTFNDVGNFSFKCTIHPQLNGVVMVTAATGQTQAPVPMLYGTQGSTQALEQILSETLGGTQVTVPSEKLYVTSAQAPGVNGATLHGAAVQPISTSLGNLGNIAVGSVQGSAQESITGSTPDVNAGSLENMPTAAQVTTLESKKKSKLTGSGPEDFVYAGIFGLVLVLNRRKLFRKKA